MKITLQKVFALMLIALVGVSVASPAQARWYDGRHYHHGHPPRYWIWDHRGYYVYAPPQGVVVAQPGYVVQQPAPVIVEQPAPVVVQRPVYEEPGVHVGVRIR